jgi:hypothetical protein
MASGLHLAAVVAAFVRSRATPGFVVLGFLASVVVAVVAERRARLQDQGAAQPSVLSDLQQGECAEARIHTAPVTEADLPPRNDEGGPGRASVPVEGATANHAWLSVVEECVALFDELEGYAPRLDAARREMVSHVTCRLREILERCGVDPISQESSFNRDRHLVEYLAAPPEHGAAIVETLSPGFAVGRRVLRRARVRLVDKSSGENGGS